MIIIFTREREKKRAKEQEDAQITKVANECTKAVQNRCIIK